ncbi:hypothetical protein C3K47_15755 [Solitalea longa]|uniref:DUF3575 domain-containing protein n=1 Tax=Solitalea longa TaxID=2079460 RepID=A0A2S4ZY03_9SPHI|nr:hypothetical protein [Solitalea longa]POY35238.1 hypothetical protein C3K47_15755 [Solitalea longa]
MKYRYYYYLLCFLTAISSRSFGQATDSLKPQLKNTIKFNLSSQLIYGKAALFSYERIVGPNEAFNVQVGYVELPDIIHGANSTIVEKRSNSRSGYTIAGDYRFYLGSENRHEAPRGVYVGPYVSYYAFKSNKLASLTTTDGGTTDVTLDSKINILNFGGLLGYQFVIKRRIAIDMILIGPSISNYSVKLNMNGDLTNVDVDEKTQEYMQALAERYPFLKDLAKNKEFKANDSNSSWSAGFRYSLSIGYRF